MDEEAVDGCSALMAIFFCAACWSLSAFCASFRAFRSSFTSLTAGSVELDEVAGSCVDMMAVLQGSQRPDRESRIIPITNQNRKVRIVNHVENWRFWIAKWEQAVKRELVIVIRDW